MIAVDVRASGNGKALFFRRHTTNSFPQLSAGASTLRFFCIFCRKVFLGTTVNHYYYANWTRKGMHEAKSRTTMQNIRLSGCIFLLLQYCKMQRACICRIEECGSCLVLVLLVAQVPLTEGLQTKKMCIPLLLSTLRKRRGCGK